MIKFRKVTPNDFHKIHFWLNIPHVKKYWDPNENFTFSEISAKYSKRLKDNKIDMYIFSFHDIDIGYIQTYFVENLSPYKVLGKAKGIDLYIGNTKYLYKGYGKSIIRLFIERFVFKDENIDFVIIDPESGNTSAIKAYNKAGFIHVNSGYNELEKVISYYMTMSRAQFFCNY